MPRSAGCCQTSQQWHSPPPLPPCVRQEKAGACAGHPQERWEDEGMKKTRQAAEKIGAMLAEDRTGQRLDPAARPAAADAERRSRDGSCCCLFTYAKELRRESSTGRSNDGKEGARHVSEWRWRIGGFRHRHAIPQPLHFRFRVIESSHRAPCEWSRPTTAR